MFLKAVSTQDVLHSSFDLCRIFLSSFTPSNISFFYTTQLANLIGHILRMNCLVKHIIEGKIEGRIEVTERRVRRRKKPLDELQEKREHSKLKEKALDRTLWRTRCLRGYEPVVRQTSGWMMKANWFSSAFYSITFQNIIEMVLWTGICTNFHSHINIFKTFFFRLYECKAIELCKRTGYRN